MKRFNKNISLLIMIAFAFCGCATKPNLNDVEYIKILSEGRADSITTYNKGLGVYSYDYYEPQTDSMIYRTVKSTYPGKYITEAGRLNNSACADTLSLLVDALRKYSNPITFDTAYTGDTYCGPELYVEFKDGKGLHYNVFILGDNDTLNQFCHFFNRLNQLHWTKKVVDNKTVNADYEAVTALKRLGLYEKRETPYIPVDCKAGIELSKIYGTWRQVGIYPETHLNRFYKFTINRNRTWSNEKIRNGKAESKKNGTFVLSPKNNSFTTEYNGAQQKYTILKLSENCFEYKKADEDYTIRYDRLQ